MDAEARRHRMDEFFEALRVLRTPAVVALLAVCLLVLPDQVRDLYRALAENLRKPDGSTIALSQAASLPSRCCSPRSSPSTSAAIAPPCTSPNPATLARC